MYSVSVKYSKSPRFIMNGYFICHSPVTDITLTVHLPFTSGGTSCLTPRILPRSAGSRTPAQ